MAAILVIAFTQTQDSGATGRIAAGPLAQSPQARESVATTPRVAPGKCPAVRRAVRFYQRKYASWQAKMGAGETASHRRLAPCPRYLLRIWRAKARGARVAYQRWWEHEYAWWKWLPDKFARVGACETGYGKRPGSWTWDSGTYVSAFGIYRPAYEAYHRWTGRNTPREQYEVAAAIQARFGWGAWGCGGA